MSKIFGIGFSKTGTTSLSRALEQLGYRAIQAKLGRWPQPDDNFDAAVHKMIAADFVALDRRYPGSQFICTLRDRKAWLASAKRHIAYMRLQGRGWSAAHETLYGCGLDGLTEDRHFLEAYDRHAARVRDHFAGRGSDILFLDLCGAPYWARLCRFLGDPAPKIGFPHANAGIDPSRYFLRPVRKLQKRLWPVRRPAHL